MEVSCSVWKMAGCSHLLTDDSSNALSFEWLIALLTSQTSPASHE
jgi:hypothetical protein